jgi:hypothetical protein
VVIGAFQTIPSCRDPGIHAFPFPVVKPTSSNRPARLKAEGAEIID